MTGSEAETDLVVAYTRARHECTVARPLECKCVAFLLPTDLRISRRSDRMKRVLAPLFPSYVFLYVSDDERAWVLLAAGVINLVSVARRTPAVLSLEC